jgi:hypothetical protein
MRERVVYCGHRGTPNSFLAPIIGVPKLAVIPGRRVTLSLPGLTGQSSNPRAIGVTKLRLDRQPGDYWIARSSWAMTVIFAFAKRRLDSGFALTRAPE